MYNYGHSSNNFNIKGAFLLTRREMSRVPAHLCEHALIRQQVMYKLQQKTFKEDGATAKQCLKMSFISKFSYGIPSLVLLELRITN